MRVLPALLGLAITATLVHAGIGTAIACTGLAPSTKLLLGADTAIPANVRGLPFTQSTTLATTTAVRLLDATGTQVAAAFEGLTESPAEHLLVPATPFVPGSYSVEVLREGSTAAEVTPFTIAASAPLPSPSVTVSAGNARHAMVTIPGGAACTSELDASVIDVTVTLARDYLPYRALTKLSGTPDQPNDWLWTYQTSGPQLPESLSQTYTLARPCASAPLTSAVHITAQVSAITLDVATASATLAFAACDDLPDGIVDATTDTPAGPATPTTTATDTSGSAVGCSTTAHANGGAAALSVAVLGLALVRRRRRR